MRNLVNTGANEQSNMAPEIAPGEERSWLANAASVVMQRLAIDERDRFLVVCNPEQAELRELADAVFDAALMHTRRASVCEYVAGERDGQEPPTAVAAAMRGASAIVLLTRFSISHTQARKQATDGGARIASMPKITREAFARALPADYGQLRRDGRALAARLSAASFCRVSSPAGTDLVLSLAGRSAVSDDGDLRTAGAFGNLPAGEAYIAPVETEAFGTIVFDGSFGDWGLIDEPVTVDIQYGGLVAATGGKAAQWLLETLDAGGKNGRVLAELGIGTNPNARLSGSCSKMRRPTKRSTSPSATTPASAARTKPRCTLTLSSFTRESNSTGQQSSTTDGGFDRADRGP